MKKGLKNVRLSREGNLDFSTFSSGTRSFFPNTNDRGSWLSAVFMVRGSFLQTNEYL